MTTLTLTVTVAWLMMARISETARRPVTAECWLTWLDYNNEENNASMLLIIKHPVANILEHSDHCTSCACALLPACLIAPAAAICSLVQICFNNDDDDDNNNNSNNNNNNNYTVFK